MGLIQIEGMEFFSFHGHYPEEKIIGNYFSIDLTIESDCTKAGETDNIEYAVNYQTVYKLVKTEMSIKSNLLENIASRIIDSIYAQLHNIDKITVKVSKINPPMGGKIQKVSVTMAK